MSDEETITEEQRLLQALHAISDEQALLDVLRTLVDDAALLRALQAVQGETWQNTHKPQT